MSPPGLQMKAGGDENLRFKHDPGLEMSHAP